MSVVDGIKVEILVRKSTEYILAETAAAWER